MKTIEYTHVRAVVFENGNPIFTIDIVTDASKNKTAEVKPYESGLHVWMWLATPLSNRSTKTCDEEFPFPEFQKQLLHLAWVESLILNFIISIVTENSLGIRHAAAQELETSLSLAPSDATQEFERIILSNTPVPGMDTRNTSFTGKSKILMKKFVEKFGHQPKEPHL